MHHCHTKKSKKFLGRGLEFFFDFVSGNGAFWCILGACFNVSIRRVKQSRKAVLCANCQIGQLSHMADVSSMISYVIIVCMHERRSKRISFITEGLPWKITVNNWSILKKKTTGTTFPLYKKEWERRSRLTRTLLSAH